MIFKMVIILSLLFLAVFLSIWFTIVFIYFPESPQDYE